MFPRSSNNGRYSDDEDESEATMIFNKKMLLDFRKAVPLPQEKANRPLGRLSMLPSTLTKGKINFDETFEEKSTSAKLSEALIESKKNLRMYQEALQEKDRYQALCQVLTEQKDALQEDIFAAKAQLLDRDNELRNASILNDSITDKETAENWKEVASKYFSWFEVSQNQLKTLCSSLSADNLLKREMVDNICRFAATIEKTDLTDDDLGNLLPGSIMDYPTPPFHTMKIVEPTLAAKDSEFMFARPSSSSVREPLSPITDADSLDLDTTADQSSFLNSTLLNISADAEKDERICRLEHENSILLDKMKVANHRASKSMVLEEQNRTLQFKCKTMKDQLSKTMAECESQRSVAAQMIQNDKENDMSFSKALEFNDRLRDSQIKLDNLKKELTASSSQCESLIQERTALLRENGNLKNSLEHKDSLIGKLDSDLAYVTDQVREVEKKLQLVTQEHELCEKKISEALLTTTSADARPSSEPTDAGDTTQIFHFANNPLFAAHQQHLMDESRKRKATDLDESVTAKRAKDEEIEALKAKIIRSEKEKESAIAIHKDYSKKFKEIVTVLTGYQVKATDLDEGICAVKSIYDDATQFFFKYHSNTKGVDLLDVRQDSNSQEIPYSDNMRRYIGERQSVPAFLASVTMHLEDQREMEEEINSQLHTCSVLYHD